MIELQRTIGNQAVLRLLRGVEPATAPPPAHPEQVSTPCACGGACPRCSAQDVAEGDGLGHQAEERTAWLGSLSAARDLRPAFQNDTENSDADIRPPDQCGCEKHEKTKETRLGRESSRFAPPQSQVTADRPREAGWWTGNWYTGSNTIICNRSGSLTIHEATSYKHGVQDCTRQHESQHMADWYARYGNDICKGRKKGDLPNFDPAGKEAYSDFLKKSECAAWKIGETCRKEKLAACPDDACKKYVQPFVTQAAQQVKKYC